MRLDRCHEIVVHPLAFSLLTMRAALMHANTDRMVGSDLHRPLQAKTVLQTHRREPYLAELARIRAQRRTGIR